MKVLVEGEGNKHAKAGTYFIRRGLYNPAEEVAVEVV